MSDAQIRVALIGLGHIGRVHVAALAQVQGLVLVAGCDHDPALAAILPAGTVFHSDHRALLAQGGFDTVIVATPNRTHNRIARDALEAGFDVLVEKPAACDLAELEAIESTARASGNHLHFAFHAALAREVDWLLAHLKAERGRFGPLTGFLCRFYDPYIGPDGGVVAHAKGLDDCWSDSGVNALSVLDRFLPVDGLRRIAQRASPGQGGKRHSLSVQFAFASDAGDNAGLGVIETAWDQGLNHKSTILFFGQTGWRLTLDHSAQTVTAHDPQGNDRLLARIEGERLFNHYLGVFEAYVAARAAGADNGPAARRIHEKLFEVSAP